MIRAKNVSFGYPRWVTNRRPGDGPRLDIAHPLHRNSDEQRSEEHYNHENIFRPDISLEDFNYTICRLSSHYGTLPAIFRTIFLLFYNQSRRVLEVDIVPSI